MSNEIEGVRDIDHAKINKAAEIVVFVGRRIDDLLIDIRERGIIIEPFGIKIPIRLGPKPTEGEL